MSDFPAVFTMHTPSGPTDACVRHARGVEALMRMLGAHVNATKAPEGAQCANCINEAAKAAPTGEAKESIAAVSSGSEAERIEFEQWYRFKNPGAPNNRLSRDGDEYVHELMADKWEGWLARAAPSSASPSEAMRAAYIDLEREFGGNQLFGRLVSRYAEACTAMGVAIAAPRAAAVAGSRSNASPDAQDIGGHLFNAAYVRADVAARVGRYVAVAASPSEADEPPSDHQILAITTAYEQGFGHGREHRGLPNPYAEAYLVKAWDHGYEEGQRRAFEAAAAPKP